MYAFTAHRRHGNVNASIHRAIVTFVAVKEIRWSEETLG